MNERHRLPKKQHPKTRTDFKLQKLNASARTRPSVMDDDAVGDVAFMARLAKQAQANDVKRSDCQAGKQVMPEALL